jgi:hypothetical protein
MLQRLRYPYRKPASKLSPGIGHLDRDGRCRDHRIPALKNCTVCAQLDNNDFALAGKLQGGGFYICASRYG